MSHVATIDLHIKDLDALEEACKALGLVLMRSKSAYKWFGTSVGDYPLPAGFKASDLGHCEHAIAIPGNSRAYEIGVVKRRDGKPGYTLLWDFWQGGYGLEAIVGKNADKLKQQYAVAVASKQLKKQGYRVTHKLQTNGTIAVIAAKG